MGCVLKALAGEMGWPRCTDWIQTHHLLSRSLLKGNAKALAYTRDGGAVEAAMTFPVCSAHNVGRYADGKVARGYLLSLRSEAKEVLETVQEFYKGGYPSLGYEALIAPWVRWRCAA